MQCFIKNKGCYLTLQVKIDSIHLFRVACWQLTNVVLFKRIFYTIFYYLLSFSRLSYLYWLNEISFISHERPSSLGNDLYISFYVNILQKWISVYNWTSFHSDNRQTEEIRILNMYWRWNLEQKVTRICMQVLFF
jgi:hypothetical protein